MKSDRNVYLHKIDFAVQKTASGQITVDYTPSSSGISMIEAGMSSGSIMGNSVLETSPFSVFYPIEALQDRLWHPIYFQTQGNCIQIHMYMTNQQMIDPTISRVDFELEGMVLYCNATDSRMQ